MVNFVTAVTNRKGTIAPNIYGDVTLSQKAKKNLKLLSFQVL